MYTLQILDAGQTFLHTIGDQPVSFGAGKEAHVCLREPGIAPVHARLTPHADGIRLTAEQHAEVLVNGAVVQQCELRLGDRVELGRVVMIVGRTVARAARPEDVLADSVPRTPRAKRPASRSSKLVPVLVAVAVLAAGVFLSMQSDDSSHVRGRLGDVESARASGDLDRARREVAILRQEWLGADDDRLALLDAKEAAIAQTEQVHAALLASVVDPANTRNYADWSRELQQLEANGTPDQKVAARKLRSRLRETLRERDERAVQLAIEARAAAGGGSVTADGGAATVRDDAASKEPRDEMGAMGAGTSAAGRAADLTDAVVGMQQANAEPIAVAEIDRLCGAGLFAQAMALVQVGFDQAADPDAVQSLRQVEQSVRQRAVQAMQSLLQDVQQSEQQDRLQHAVTLLQMGRHNFPSGSDFEKLGDELQRLQARVHAAEQAALAKPAVAAPAASDALAVDEATRLQTLESLRGHMAAVRTAEDNGDYAEQAKLLREAAQGVQSRDAEFAARLLAQADEAAQLAGFHDAVVAVVASGKPLSVQDRRGREVAMVRIEGRRIVGRSADGDAPIDWLEVDAASLQQLAKQIKASGEVALGLAAMLYKSGDAKQAETLLATVIRDDAKLQPDVDQLLARGRGEAGHGHTYTLRKGEFVSLRKIELEKHSKKLLSKLEAAMRQKDTSAGNQSAGNQFVSETVALGQFEVDALVFAMRDQFAKIEARVEASAVRKQVEKMVAERDRLDAARKHAKDLIFDSVRYFYPYKPPAVSGEKFAEYNRVQADVAERVAAVHDIWHKSTIKLNVPKQLEVDLEQLDWLATHLSRLGGLPEGESIASFLAPMAWARALEPGEIATVRNFCLTPEERWEHAEWRRIEAYNEATAEEFSVAVRSLLKITNEYRAMFGHRPLAAVKSACEGSQGHADEMSRLGYFSHMSPVAGRRTPGDRMRLAGYPFGVSENIAIAGGALASHNAWCTSSGHHRNLLTASHREIGIGANGRYWVQNFGSGEVYKTHPVWSTLSSK